MLSFWKSSHYEQWILDPADLIRERSEDMKIYTEDEYQKILMFFMEFIIETGRDPSLDKSPIHMQALSAACIYFRRFYARRSFKDVDPFLLAPTCILLAAKVEESGILQPNKLINAANNALKSKWPQLESFLQEVRWPNVKFNDLLTTLIKPQQLNETEFYILVVYHPYRALTQLLKDFKNCSDRIDSNDALYADAWRICNDSLRCDIPLLYPPHLIAIAAIMIAAVTTNGDASEEKLKLWLADLNVDYERVYEIQQILFHMYSLWKGFNLQKEMRPLLEKLPKPSF